jgi:hypothetical protein
MAGGKETPRQKMIGMMYLVLTALLALNVSKSILDAFVAIEENIQIANENEYYRGAEKFAELEEVADDKTNPEAQKKAKALLKSVEQIDKIVAKEIKFIDDLKKKILEACGEDLKKPEGGEESIIFKTYKGGKEGELRPVRMKLANVNSKDKYDEPMQIMGIGDNIANPTGKGKELWTRYLNFRKQITELIASSQITQPGQKKYFFKSPDITSFKDFKDMNKQIDDAIKKSNINPDDVAAIKKIYGSLTKKEKDAVHDLKDVHWIGRTFDHSPVVAAIASLSSLEKEILTARADAVTLIRDRVGGGEYSFNKIMPLAYGPELATKNDEVTVEVLMVAYDSDKQPEVTVSGGTLKEVKDGKGIIKANAGGGDMTLRGTITIRNKSGIPKTESWEKQIKVMAPSGTVSLPDMRVLYKGYANKLEAVASGYDQTVLSASAGVSLSKQGQFYIAQVTGAQGKATITVSGKSSITNKTVKLQSMDFKISKMPKPDMFWGKGAAKITVKYGPEIPLTNASFQLTSWTMTIQGFKQQFKGTGNSISPEAKRVIDAAPPGTMVGIIGTYSGTGAAGALIEGSFKL